MTCCYFLLPYQTILFGFLFLKLLGNILSNAFVGFRRIKSSQILLEFRRSNRQSAQSKIDRSVSSHNFRRKAIARHHIQVHTANKTYKKHDSLSSITFPFLSKYSLLNKLVASHHYYITNSILPAPLWEQETENMRL